MQKKKISKKLECLKTMPPLEHTVGQIFTYDESQVFQWAIKQNMIKDWICQCLVNSKYISYNPFTKTWQGVNYDENEN